MIFTDSKGYLSDRTKDGGDSAVRAGIVAICGGNFHHITDYVQNGICVRNPWQEPWNNSKNFTKDQLKLLVAGLFAIGRTDLCREILDAHKKREWCQSSERDAVGSVKMMRPHAFYKDSKPDATTVPMRFNFKTFKFEVVGLDKSHTIETKMFDHADMLMPNDWLFLEVAAGVKKPEGFGLWWHRQALSQHANGDHNEENQMFAECFVLGTLRDYVNVNKKWQARNEAYWLDRNEIEYHKMMLDFVAKQIHRDFLAYMEAT